MGHPQMHFVTYLLTPPCIFTEDLSEMAIVLPMGVLSERLKWTLTKIESTNLSNGGWISDEQFYFSSTTETPTTILSTTTLPTNKKMVNFYLKYKRLDQLKDSLNIILWQHLSFSLLPTHPRK